MTKTLSLLDARRQWLDVKTKVNASNIAKSDIKGSFRNELVPFKTFWKEYQKNQKGEPFLSKPNLSAINVIATKEHAKRDQEMIEINKNSLEHQAVLGMISSFHKMMRSAISSSGG